MKAAKIRERVSFSVKYDDEAMTMEEAKRVVREFISGTRQWIPQEIEILEIAPNPTDSKAWVVTAILHWEWWVS